MLESNNPTAKGGVAEKLGGIFRSLITLSRNPAQLWIARSLLPLELIAIAALLIWGGLWNG